MSKRPEDREEHWETIEERFQNFLMAHPEAWTEFCRRVDQLRARGVKHYSADGILHVLRFHTAIDGRDMETYKINNDYSRLFSRKWQEENPEILNFFENRAIKSA